MLGDKTMSVFDVEIEQWRKFTYSVEVGQYDMCELVLDDRVLSFNRKHVLMFVRMEMNTDQPPQRESKT